MANSNSFGRLDAFRVSIACSTAWMKYRLTLEDADAIREI